MQEQNNNSTPSPTVPNKAVLEVPVPSASSQQPVQTPLVQPPPATPPAPLPQLPKSGFPKKLFFIIGGVFIALVLILVVVKVLVPKIGTGSKQVKITWWSLEEDAEAVDPIIKEYQEKNPNVVIEFVKQSQQDYQERLANALSGGQGPDIFEFHNTWVPMYINVLSVVPSNVYSEATYSGTFYPVAVSDLRTKDGFVGIPLEYDGIGLLTNQDIFQAYGKSSPKTWDDLRSIASELTIRDQTGNITQAGVALGQTENVDYWQDIFAVLALQNGVDLTKPVSSQGQSTLAYFTNFYKVDHVWDGTLPTSTVDFASGKLAMYFGAYAQVFNIKKQNPNLRFGVVPLPQLPKNDPNAPSISYASYWVNGVAKKSTNGSIAWDFLRFMSEASTLRKLYENEVKVRGYGNLYPRIDMQSELLSDPMAGPFIYQASYAKSWYLAAKTFDGATGINTQVAKPYADAINTTNLSTTSEKALEGAQTALTQVLASYGLVAIPRATGK